MGDVGDRLSRVEERQAATERRLSDALATMRAEMIGVREDISGMRDDIRAWTTTERSRLLAETVQVQREGQAERRAAEAAEAARVRRAEVVEHAITTCGAHARELVVIAVLGAAAVGAVSVGEVGQVLGGLLPWRVDHPEEAVAGGPGDTDAP